jgi:hypothetical protein
MEVVHVYPTGEEELHRLVGIRCACNPKLEHYPNATLVIHNAFDARELIEDAKGPEHNN